MKTTDNLFEIAIRSKYRYIYKGVITTEDLWDLDVVELNEIFKSLKSEQRKATEESLLAQPTLEDTVLDNKIAIIRHIVSTKLDEARQAGQAKELHDKRQKLMAIMAEKQDAALRAKSPEELQKMLEEMGE